MTEGGKFSTTSRRPKPATLLVIVLLHLLAIYGLARAFAPDMTQTVEQSVVAAFTVTVTTRDPPPEENEPVPDEGAAGSAGKKATPKPDTAPKVPIERDQPMPKASSTGAANTSGAKDEGEGTGAAGEGTGTGSGLAGGGMGGVAVTKPVHISGAIDNARDYPVPEGGRKARIGNEVIVRVVVGKDGRARNCTVYRASPDSQADQITCRLVEDRLRFKPAMDRNGNPVAAPFFWRQRWF
ncbi:TonB family protein [Pontixanthobacter luteolus]|uniref:TonB family protein n=1 Tax=Pontixanthobacter luteolus TaxID=295089 RepID=UPI00230354C5|nr:TonB family protein [Pontixanthobacter luteolus]